MPRTSKKLYRPRKNARKGRKNFRKARDVPDMASLSVKRSLSVGGNQFAGNTLYSLMNTQLIDFPRACQVAAAYQHYRINKVTLTFKPSFDTFTNGGASTKPNLYHIIDKSGSIPTNSTLEGLKQMGAKPRQLDEKNLIVSWRPSVLESVMVASGGAGGPASSKYNISPWLTTTADNVSPGAFSPSGVDHLGVYWYLDQLLAGGYQYSVECEVQFQFKKPLINNVSSVSAIPAQLARLNNSPDGIEGGGDGI